MPRSARRRIAAWLLALAGGGAQACGGTDVGAPSTDGGADAAGDSSAGDGVVRPDADSSQADFGVCPAFPEVGGAPADCTGCVDALCKDESIACAADDNCTKQVTCFASCKSSACQADCLSAFPSAAGRARFDCIRCRCEKQCTLPTG
jgi:hypothetical protein